MEATEVKLNFMPMKQAIAAQWEAMQKHQLFRVEVSKDEIWEHYLSAFPPGTNGKFRERTHHDCSCCKQFIRAVGNVVAIVDYEIVTVWDVVVKQEPAYTEVAKKMANLIRSRVVNDAFLHYEAHAGTDRNFEQLTEGQITWNHYYVNISKQFVEKGADIPSKLSLIRSTHDVFARGLNEITLEALDTVLELAGQNSIYRGEEFKFQVGEFRKLKVEYSQLGSESKKEAYAWVTASQHPHAVTNIRNTAIGTLLNDLSADVDLEEAVKKFEGSVMAPANYKRPTALVSKAQIEKAKQTLQELGLLSALDRRFATVDDITINNVLFRDRTVKSAMGDVFDELSASTPTKVKTLDKVEEVPIERFMLEILPRAQSLEVLFENKHVNNLVSLIAPTDPTAGKLFRWDNRFSWSYVGNMADSIKERVKKAGGSVTGDLCCRLAWDYKDDLDFHMKEPGGHEIFYANRSVTSPNGGRLDVDANGCSGMMEEPVENIFYANKDKMREGLYKLWVHNYYRRESSNEKRGFTVELEFGGQTYTVNYDKVVRQGEKIEVATIQFSKKEGFSIRESLPSSTTSRTVWNLPTQQFHKVSIIMLSPNYWDMDASRWPSGNKHYFFMLEGCKNDGTARGFFNEFLSNELTEHRRVLEMVGGKMKVADSQDQLSGLGFSSTKKETLVVRVKGSFSRQVKIVF